MKYKTLAVVFILLLCSAVHAQTLPPEKDTALGKAEALNAEIHYIAMALWQYAETGLQEVKSAALLAGILEEEGFSVERGVAGMPTAFVATYGKGTPIIGILAEYDALPGVGNAPVPNRAPRPDGAKTGHGCGHNLFAAGSVCSAIAVKRTLEVLNIPGTVRLYGTPAEETLVGKVYMAKAGLFDDLDAAINWHPMTRTDTHNQSSLAMNNFSVEFFGQAAHGAIDPWNGRSALDAVELMNHGVNMMREHVRPSARMHYVIPRAGDAPNVVPEYAKVWYFVRDLERTSVDKHYAWILRIAEGAALATQTTHKVSLITGVHATILNRPLQEAVQANLELVGPPQFTEEEQSFARELQRSLGIEEKGFDDEIAPLADTAQTATGGSTDVAEVSFITPTVGFYVASAPAGIPWHSWAATASHGTSAAVKSAAVATKVIALTALDLLTDPKLLEDARATFLEKTAGKPYKSPIPVDQRPPLPNTVSPQ